MDEVMTAGEVVIKFLQDKKMTIQELARKLRVPEDAVYGWIDEEREVRGSVKTRLAKLTGVKQFETTAVHAKRKADWKKGDSLCWKCANSVPDALGKRGCSWSEELRPVKGWLAEYSVKCDGMVSWQVMECPEFICD
ncbi:MAG: helix-turn-helix transcriptional regulator [Clostridia bacterium]|nr:helix-turn-helix transcriptional regulator [Clostridia bacterium]